MVRKKNDSRDADVVCNHNSILLDFWLGEKMISNDKREGMTLSKKDKAILVASMNAIRANLAVVNEMLELNGW